MRKRSPLGSSLLASLPIVLLLCLALTFWVVTALGLYPAGLDALSLSPAQARAAIGEDAAEIVETLNKGQTSVADSRFSQAARGLGGGSGAYAALAAEITRRGRPADAARYLSAAVKDNALNWDPNVWWALSQAQSKANDPVQATRSAAEADRRAAAVMATIGQPAPGSRTETQLRLARLLQVGEYYADDKQDGPAAVRMMEEAVRLAPQNAVALNALAYLLADRGTTPAEFDRAVELSRKSITIEPDEPIFLDTYGWALFKKNDLPGARRVLREAVDAAPDEPDLRYHLGVVYAQLGLIDDARRELERALVLNPEMKQAQTAIDGLKVPVGHGVTESA